MKRVGYKVMPFKDGEESIIRSGANSRIEFSLEDMINNGVLEMDRRRCLSNAS